MDEEDYANRWHRAIWNGKSNLEKRLERELKERRDQDPKPQRKPLKWYWWIAIAAGLIVWTFLAFATYDFS